MSLEDRIEGLERGNKRLAARLRRICALTGAVVLVNVCAFTLGATPDSE